MNQPKNIGPLPTFESFLNTRAANKVNESATTAGPVTESMWKQITESAQFSAKPEGLLAYVKEILSGHPYSVKGNKTSITITHKKEPGLPLVTINFDKNKLITDLGDEVDVLHQQKISKNAIDDVTYCLIKEFKLEMVAVHEKGDFSRPGFNMVKFLNSNLSGNYDIAEDDGLINISTPDGDVKIDTKSDEIEIPSKMKGAPIKSGAKISEKTINELIGFLSDMSESAVNEKGEFGAPGFNMVKHLNSLTGFNFDITEDDGLVVVNTTKGRVTIDLKSDEIELPSKMKGAPVKNGAKISEKTINQLADYLTDMSESLSISMYETLNPDPKRPMYDAEKANLVQMLQKASGKKKISDIAEDAISGFLDIYCGGYHPYFSTPERRERAEEFLKAARDGKDDFDGYVEGMSPVDNLTLSAWKAAKLKQGK